MMIATFILSTHPFQLTHQVKYLTLGTNFVFFFSNSKASFFANYHFPRNNKLFVRGRKKKTE